MKQAVANVAKDAGVPLGRVRVWLDIHSIPQINQSEQKLAIASLPTFAAVCNYFVVVAPNTIHADTDDVCDSRSYRRRAELPKMNRGDAAAATWIYSQKRVGCDMDIQWKTSRGDVAAATWTFSGDECTPQVPPPRVV